MSSSQENRFFFCYSRADSEFVLKLATDLRDASARIWMDQLDILGGEHWDSAVEQALKACKGIIVVMSPTSVASNDVRDEVTYAISEGKQIIPLMYKSCEVPMRLRRLQFVDFASDPQHGFDRLLAAMRLERAAQAAAPESATQAEIKAENKPQEREQPRAMLTPAATDESEASTVRLDKWWLMGPGIGYLLGTVISLVFMYVFDVHRHEMVPVSFVFGGAAGLIAGAIARNNRRARRWILWGTLIITLSAYILWLSLLLLLGAEQHLSGLTRLGHLHGKSLLFAYWAMLLGAVVCALLGRYRIKF